MRKVITGVYGRVEGKLAENAQKGSHTYIINEVFPYLFLVISFLRLGVSIFRRPLVELFVFIFRFEVDEKSNIIPRQLFSMFY
jgi:hypothetical protein